MKPMLYVVNCVKMFPRVLCMSPSDHEKNSIDDCFIKILVAPPTKKRVDGSDRSDGFDESDG